MVRNQKAMKGTGSGRGEGSGSGSGGAKGEHGSGTGSGGGAGGGGGSGGPPAIVDKGFLPTPAYPPLSIENGEEGIVHLSILVQPGGKVVKVTVTKSSGFQRLDNAARKAATAAGSRYPTNRLTEYRGKINFQLQ